MSDRSFLARFEPRIAPYPEGDRRKILSAARWAAAMHHGQKRASGEPYIVHPLRVAETLIDLRMDAPSVIAALLHDVLEDTEITRRDLRREYGREVEGLVEGVTKISVIRGMSRSAQQAETIRKMLFAMVKDIRVILIKLADKLHNMRTLEFLDEKGRKRIAGECLEIYAPLAGRLGISWLKSELEDLSLKHLNPDVYGQIERFVAERRQGANEYLEGLIERLRREAAHAEIPLAIEARAKHYYSIYSKMKRKGKILDEIYDLFGLRLICDTPSECYELLGIVHTLWMPIEGRFKDYVAMPKSNRYQSLHTTVMGTGGKMIEIQIRTHLMHQTAEHGIASHWMYKAEGFGREIHPEQLRILNMLKTWEMDKAAGAEFLEGIKKELLKDSIYVFTPKGDIVELPKGATALDFAYHIHTEVGNHCLAAKADGVAVRLNEELKNTQVIEIVTAPGSRPHLNWLRFVKTHRTRNKIRHWLTQHDPNLFIDRNIVARNRVLPPAKSEEPEKHLRDTSRVGVRLGDERNLMIRFARCCQPITGDPIIGYISRGRGLIIHQKSCPNLRYIPEFGERSVEVEWETVSPKAFRRFQVTARSTRNLFSEIEGAIRKFHGHLVEGKLEDGDTGDLNGFFTIELDDREDFNRVLKSLRTLPSIIKIQAARQG